MTIKIVFKKDEDPTLYFANAEGIHVLDKFLYDEVYICYDIMIPQADKVWDIKIGHQVLGNKGSTSIKALQLHYLKRKVDKYDYAKFARSVYDIYAIQLKEYHTISNQVFLFHKLKCFYNGNNLPVSVFSFPKYKKGAYENWSFWKCNIENGKYYSKRNGLVELSPDKETKFDGVYYKISPIGIPIPIYYSNSGLFPQNYDFELIIRAYVERMFSINIDENVFGFIYRNLNDVESATEIQISLTEEIVSYIVSNKKLEEISWLLGFEEAAIEPYYKLIRDKLKLEHLHTRLLNYATNTGAYLLDDSGIKYKNNITRDLCSENIKYKSSGDDNYLLNIKFYTRYVSQNCVRFYLTFQYFYHLYKKST